jgi:UDPglucose 6-dehydrogenase
MKITVIGTGYVGLVAGACFADSGNHVVCLDVNPQKIDILNQGGIPIYEPGLEEIVRRNKHEGRIVFTTDAQMAIDHGKVIFIAVGTPQDDDGSADLTYVLEAARSIGRLMNGPKIVVDKSTVPVGTAEKVAAAIREVTTHKVSVVSNPEFLKEGNAIEDFMSPDRVVIGADDEEARKVMAELYDPFMRTGRRILFMDPRSAEMAKYAANAFLATKVTFMNEMANLCDALGADVDLVRRAVGSDARIGSAFLFPGIGYGGSCFPKDVSAIRRMGADAGYPLRVLDSVDMVNTDQKSLLVKKVVEFFGEDLTGKRFAIWGLSFKPKTDDMREAPALTIIRALIARGAKVAAHDPEAMKEAKRLLGDSVELCDTPEAALKGADALLVCTEWSVYRQPDYEAMKTLLRHPVVLDGRNIYDPARMRELGFTYYGVGRKIASKA